MKPLFRLRYRSFLSPPKVTFLSSSFVSLYSPCHRGIQCFISLLLVYLIQTFMYMDSHNMTLDQCSGFDSSMSLHVSVVCFCLLLARNTFAQIYNHVFIPPLAGGQLRYFQIFSIKSKVILNILMQLCVCTHFQFSGKILKSGVVIIVKLGSLFQDFFKCHSFFFFNYGKLPPINSVQEFQRIIF